MDLGTDEFVDLTEVGRGGFGVVYRAHQPAFDRWVAVKVITLLNEDTRRRFDRERQALGAVSHHPNIPAVYASGFTPEGFPYLAMAYLGRSLADRIEGDGPVDWQNAVHIGIRLAGALETAHRAGILHRDLKPENVLFDPFGEPQLSDFGIARVVGRTHTASGVITASLLYAAPEILQGKPPSVASDVYSLAATIHAMLAGTAPFQRDDDETPIASLLRTLQDDVPDLRERVPAAVCDVTEWALAKDPAQRPPTAAELGVALQEAQRSLGVPVTPMSLLSDSDVPAPGPREPVPVAAKIDVVAPVEPVAPVPTTEPAPEPEVAGPADAEPVTVTEPDVVVVAEPDVVSEPVVEAEPVVEPDVVFEPVAEVEPPAAIAAPAAVAPPPRPAPARVESSTPGPAPRDRFTFGPAALFAAVGLLTLAFSLLVEAWGMTDFGGHAEYHLGPDNNFSYLDDPVTLAYLRFGYILGLVAALGGSVFTLGLAERWNRRRLAVTLVALLGLAGIWHISLVADLNDHLRRLGKPLAGLAGPLGASGYGLVIVGVLLFAFTQFDRWRARQS